MEWLGTSGGISTFRGVRPAGSRQPREVAVRIADDPQDAAAARRIEVEHDTLRAMDDPRIPRVYGHYAAMGAIALTWVRGVTLADVMVAWHEDLVPLDAPTAFDVLVEVAHALRHAHSVVRPEGPVLHGHLSPERVRLVPGGGVFVMGFGDPLPPRARYAAPEQVAGAFADARTDQWALGLLAVEFLSGEALPDGATEGADTLAAAQRRLEKIGARWPEVTRVLRRMLTPAAGDRYDRDSEMIRQLLAAARTLPGPVDRASLQAKVEAQAERIAARRGPRAPVEAATRPAGDTLIPVPLEPRRPSPPAEPPPDEVGGDNVIDFPHFPEPEVVIAPKPAATPQRAPAVRPRPEDPPGPAPLPRFRFTEVLGIAFGLTLVVLGLVWLFTRW